MKVETDYTVLSLLGIPVCNRFAVLKINGSLIY